MKQVFRGLFLLFEFSGRLFISAGNYLRTYGCIVSYLAEHRV